MVADSGIVWDDSSESGSEAPRGDAPRAAPKVDLDLEEMKVCGWFCMGDLGGLTNFIVLGP
jgi:hypothetical protein